MKVIPFLAESLGAHLAGGKEFAAMKSLVEDIESSAMSGPEKRASVIEDFKKIGYELGGWVVETILQLAVILVKSKLH